MKNETEIAILGAGGWGTALGVTLAKRGHRVRLWGRDSAHVAGLVKKRENEAYLPGIALPKALGPTADFADLRGASLVLFVTPSRALRDVAGMLARSGLDLAANVPLLSCTKGIEHGSGQRMSEILHEFFPQNPVAGLSGPSHAEEVARGTPTAVVLGAEDAEVAARLQAIFNGDSLRAYTTDDLAGVELGGALKNVFALAAGVADGLGLGDNAKAALVTRALAEMIRLGTRLGGRRETFQGLSGIGDLMVTCFSRYSRNRQVGERLGRGESLEKITGSMRMVAEGVPTARSAQECARRVGIHSPIIDQVFALLYEKRPPAAALRELLLRDPRPERDDG